MLTAISGSDETCKRNSTKQYIINLKNTKMKKLILSIFVAITVIGYTACKKDINNQLPNQQQENEMMKRGKKVASLIQNFKEKMDSDLKSGTDISLDSAIWNMEASLNYDFAQPDSASLNFITRKSVYTLTIDANQLSSITDVETVYGSMEDTLVMQYNALSNTVKIVVMSDVSLDSTDGTTAYISVTNGFGLDLPSAYTPFAEDDDWIWGTLGGPLAGKCDGTMIGVSDGSNELQKRLNNPLLVPGEQIYFTDLITLWVTGFDFTDENSDPRLYIGWDYPVNNCLTNDTLTYYLWQSDAIIHTYDSEGGLRPFNKSFVRLEIRDDVIVSSSTFNFHQYLVTYGIPTLVPPGD